MNSDKKWFYTHSDLPTPISVTHDEMQKGRQQQTFCKKSTGSEIHLFSLSLNSQKDDKQLSDAPVQPVITTTYRRHYHQRFVPKCPAIVAIDNDLDPLFNRRPVNAFEMRPWAPQKFMDDHFFLPNESRKRINFLRQIRQTSNLNYFDASTEG